MTVVVARHGVPAGPEAEKFSERLGRHLAKGIDGLEESADMIDSTFSTAVLALQARCVIDPRAAAVETWEAAVNAMQLGSALFAVTDASEGSVACLAYDGEFSIEVESEYLPKHLLQRGWLGEYPT